jgi:hypothetical protein
MRRGIYSRAAKKWIAVVASDTIATPLTNDDGGGKFLDRFRIEPTKQQQPNERKHKKGCVVVPMAWVERLTKAKRLGTSKLAHQLLYAFWRNHGVPITVSNMMATKAGLHRNRKALALSELEELGLILVERCAWPQAPVVTALLLTD